MFLLQKMENPQLLVDKHAILSIVNCRNMGRYVGQRKTGATKIPDSHWKSKVVNLPNTMTLNAEKPPKAAVFQKIGPSGAIRTLGPVNPNHVRYQLRYTRIFFWSHYSTNPVRLKVFCVCGHLCGQSGFSARFCQMRKSRKCPCSKAFRASASLAVDGTSNAPKLCMLSILFYYSSST